MTSQAIITRQDPPQQSRIAKWYENADLVDSYAVALPADCNSDIRVIGQAILGRPTIWFKTLLFIRDSVMRPFGVKTSSDLIKSNSGGDQIDFFPVLSSYDDESILGEDDKHLDFRLSVLRQRTIGGPDLVFATTAVRCHNRLGRIYLAAITPFHRMVVLSKLRQAVNAGFVPS